MYVCVCVCVVCVCNFPHTPHKSQSWWGKWERSEEEASLRKYLTGQGHHCPPLHPSHHSFKANKLIYFSWELKQFSWGVCLHQYVPLTQLLYIHLLRFLPVLFCLFVWGKEGILCFLKIYIRQALCWKRSQSFISCMIQFIWNSEKEKAIGMVARDKGGGRSDYRGSAWWGFSGCCHYILSFFINTNIIHYIFFFFQANSPRNDQYAMSPFPPGPFQLYYPIPFPWTSTTFTLLLSPNSMSFSHHSLSLYSPECLGGLQVGGGLPLPKVKISWPMH